MKLNEKIIKLRAKNNLSQQDLADKVFVSRQAVQKWEKGKAVPSIDVLKQLSSLFNISLDDLLNDDYELEGEPTLVEETKEEKIVPENVKPKKKRIWPLIVFPLLGIALAISIIPINKAIVNSTKRKDDTQQEQKEKEKESPYARPITKLTIDLETQAVYQLFTHKLKVTVEPADTDEPYYFVSTNQHYVSIDNEGNIQALRSGEPTAVGVESASKKVRTTATLFVNYLTYQNDTKFGEMASMVLDQGLIKITTKAYNTILGIPKDVITHTFYGTIFKQVGNKYYYVAPYNYFVKPDDREYMEWKAVDYYGNELTLDGLQHSEKLSVVSHLCVGSFASNTNLKTLGFGEYIYYKNEKIITKTVSDDKWSSTYLIKNNSSGSSPVSFTFPYNESLITNSLGSPVVNADICICGIIAPCTGGNRDYMYFVPCWEIQKLIDICSY